MDKSGYLLIFFLAMGIIGFIMTVYDKGAAKKGRHRISERALMLEALFGGAVGMYITMHLIRHKTQHKKFMIGLPVMIVLHIAVIAVTVLT